MVTDKRSVTFILNEDGCYSVAVGVLQQNNFLEDANRPVLIDGIPDLVPFDDILVSIWIE